MAQTTPTTTEVPTDTPTEEQSLALRGRLEAIATVVRSHRELEEAQEAFVAARLGLADIQDGDQAAAQEAIEKYLYVIMPDEHNRLPKPIVGPQLDFKWQMAALMAREGVQLTVTQPVIEDAVVTVGDRKVPVVRVLVGVQDSVIGLVKWAAKEVQRAGGTARHAATIAIETAQGKALESHPLYNRALVRRQIVELLRTAGINPDDVVVAGGSSGPWSDLFKRAARSSGAAGRAGAREVRERIRAAAKAATGGKGFSGVQTAEEAQAAVRAADQEIARGPVAGEGELASEGSGGVVPDPAPPPASVRSEIPAGDHTVAAIARLRADCQDYATRLGISAERLDRLWRAVKPRADLPRLRYERLYHVLERISAGESDADACAAVMAGHPEPTA